MITVLFISIGICLVGISVYIGWIIYMIGYARGTADEIKRSDYGPNSPRHS